MNPVYQDIDGDYWFENDEGLYDLVYWDGTASEYNEGLPLPDVAREFGPIVPVENYPRITVVP